MRGRQLRTISSRFLQSSAVLSSWATVPRPSPKQDLRHVLEAARGRAIARRAGPQKNARKGSKALDA
eukprot:5995761-Alexandrium_andersonii.AAC.1